MNALPDASAIERLIRSFEKKTGREGCWMRLWEETSCGYTARRSDIQKGSSLHLIISPHRLL